MIEVSFNNVPLYNEKLLFNGGEIHPKNIIWKGVGRDPKVLVTANIRSSDDIMELLLVTDAIRREVEPSHMHLLLPYLPYARQDRVCNRGEAFSVKVMTNLINSMGYDKVTIHDCHSDVGTALINNCVNVSQEKLFESSFRYDVVISPDAGANKKTLAFAKYFGIKEVIRADKVRDVSTGKILETIVYKDLKHFEGKVLVIDDICDGGRTFLELAKVVRTDGFHGQLDLHVTHGIFSKGKEELLKLYDNVTATYDWTEDK